MPSVTHDSRSFLIDGRRIWLASGRIPYAKVPRDSWNARILAAKHAGLNTIETPLIWSRHEARQGRYDFTGENDIRHFVDLVGKAGLYCIIGLGPFVGGSSDFGGLPPWLRDVAGGKLRVGGGLFLEHCSRFFTAVSDQIKGWQATAPGEGGPIVLLQLESEWTCGHDAMAQSYLGELTRYVREAGLNVPIVNSNNMWAGVEGHIDGWAGNGPMLGTMRQLAVVRPGQPRIVIDLNFASQTHWGHEAESAPDGLTMQRRIAEVLAGGGQFNLTGFCGGTHVGFAAGRAAEAPGAYATADASNGCLIDAIGKQSRALADVRKISHAASRFARVFANLDPSYAPVCFEPLSTGAGAGSKESVTGAVIHSRGPQGGVAFVFGSEPGVSKPRLQELSLLMPDGASLPVPLMSDSVAWCFFDVNVSGRAKLDYTNLSALGAVGQTIVLFGPAGAQAIVCVNGSPLETPLPAEGEAPVIVPHEGLTLVLVSSEQAEQVFFTDDAVLIGVAGLTPAGTARVAPGSKSYVRVSGEGQSKTIHAEPPQKPRASRVVLSEWAMACVSDYIDGSSERYASVQGSRELGALGCPQGYGWYRLSFPGKGAEKGRVIFPEAGDRLQVFAEGHSQAVVGSGPGAERVLSFSPPRADKAMVILADNLGRTSGGHTLGEPKGLTGPGYLVSTIRVAKPRVETGSPVDVLGFRAPLWGFSEGDATSPERITWTLPGKRKAPVIMLFDEMPEAALLMVNDTAVAFVDHAGPAIITISPEHLGKASNLVQLAPVAHGAAEAMLALTSRAVHFEQTEGDVMAGADVGFAKWEPPSAAAFQGKHRHAAGTPAWYRASFEANPADGPLVLSPVGMTKGQVFINGKHLCRYFVATASGKRVPPQSEYVIPASWFQAGVNEILLFDEHGGQASKCKLGR